MFAHPLPDDLPPTAISPPVLPDEDIVAQVCAGQTEQFELLMRRHNQRLFRLMKALGLDDARAEDVMQDAYLRAFESLSRFRGDSRFSTWLIRIAINAANERRKPLCAASSLDLADSLGADDPTSQPVRSAELGELRSTLAAAVDELPESLRIVFVMRAVEGLSSAEVADSLTLSESNVNVRLHRAKEQLRTWIDDRLGEEARRLYEFAGTRCNRIVAGVLQRLR